DPAFKPLDIRTAPTFDYMAPEQIKGFEIDPRADLYSFGVLLFELMTGKLPFESLSKRGVTAIKHLEAKAPSPRSLNSEIPPELDQLILTCLEKDISKRFESASDLVEQLKALSGQSQFVTSKIERGSQILLSSQFIHRDAQLAKLLKFFDQAQSNYFSEFIIITGEVGVGKSRLLAEFKLLRQAYEQSFFSLQCLAQEATPLYPFLQMIESLIKRWPRESIERQKLVEKQGDTLISLCPNLMKEPDLFHCHKTENLSLSERQRMVLSFLQDLIDSQFIAIFLENLQWCDSYSVEVLEMIFNAPSKKRLFLSGTYLGESVLEETPFQRLFYRLKMNRKIQEIPLT
ncbi:MAG: AAA family ATPase, partial [Planctomycetota bacterium]